MLIYYGLFSHLLYFPYSPIPYFPFLPLSFNGGRAGFPFVVALSQLHFYNVVRVLPSVSIRQQAKIALVFQQAITAILAAWVQRN